MAIEDSHHRPVTSILGAEPLNHRVSCNTICGIATNDFHCGGFWSAVHLHNLFVIPSSGITKTHVYNFLSMCYNDLERHSGEAFLFLNRGVNSDGHYLSQPRYTTSIDPQQPGSPFLSKSVATVSKSSSFSGMPMELSLIVTRLLHQFRLNRRWTSADIFVFVWHAYFDALSDSVCNAPSRRSRMSEHRSPVAFLRLGSYHPLSRVKCRSVSLNLIRYPEVSTKFDSFWKFIGTSTWEP